MPDSVIEQCQVLPDAEASRRALLLAELQAALTALGARAVLARKHRLVLRYNAGSSEPSGLVDPELHVLSEIATGIVTTDGTTYKLAGGGEYPAADPAAAAAAVLSGARR